MNHPQHKGKKEASQDLFNLTIISIVMIVCVVIGAGIGWVAYDHFEIKVKQEQKK